MEQKMKVLIVEDEYLIAFALMQGLNRMGYETCKPVSNGELAIEHAREERPDMVVMDLRLAGKMDGMEAGRMIHRRYGIPILFISGHMNEQICHELADVRPVACLTKPVQAHDVHGAIQKYFYCAQ